MLNKKTKRSIVIKGNSSGINNTGDNNKINQSNYKTKQTNNNKENKGLLGYLTSFMKSFFNLS